MLLKSLVKLEYQISAKQKPSRETALKLKIDEIKRENERAKVYR